LYRFAHDEVDIGTPIPLDPEDPCGVLGDDFDTGAESDVTATPITPDTCTYVLTPDEEEVGNEAGSGSFDVTTLCAWSAFSDSTWLRITSATAGTGNATIEYEYDANPSTTARVGHIYVKGAVFTVIQTWMCVFLLRPTSYTWDYHAGTGGFRLTASQSTCAWTAVSSADWLTIITFPNTNSGPSGVGNAIIRYQFTENALPGYPTETTEDTYRRVATITVGGKIFTVYQEGTAVGVLGAGESGGEW
jgi:hypothetical protein